jgi:hypothetical protein
MRSTLCKLFLVPAIAAAAAFVSQPAHAETVNVPFAFTALGHSFPAGTYTVEKDLGAKFVTLHLKGGDKTLIRVLGPGDADPGDNRVVLRFNTEGNSHMLDSIQFGARITSHMPEGTRARELATGPGSGQ